VWPLPCSRAAPLPPLTPPPLLAPRGPGAVCPYISFVAATQVQLLSPVLPLLHHDGIHAALAPTRLYDCVCLNVPQANSRNLTRPPANIRSLPLRCNQPRPQRHQPSRPRSLHHRCHTHPAYLLHHGGYGQAALPIIVVARPSLLLSWPAAVTVLLAPRRRLQTQIPSAISL